jgi:hypothetical protein
MASQYVSFGVLAFKYLENEALPFAVGGTAPACKALFLKMKRNFATWCTGQN